jgi:hypothetical protein
MKRHIFSPLLMLCVAAVAAQTPAAMDAPAGVSVLKFNWHNVSYRPGWDDSSVSAASQSLEDPRTSPTQDLGASRAPVPLGTQPRRARESIGERGSPPRQMSDASASTVSAQEISPPTLSGPTRRKEEYVYQAQIRNAGEGTIEAVDWEYLFLDASTGGEMARHRFQTFSRARPGKSTTLVGNSVAPPTRVVNAAAHSGKRNPFEERIVIRCIAYADGTMRWRAGGAESDCNDIKTAAAQARRQ